jgi:hypothetical protein
MSPRSPLEVFVQALPGDARQIELTDSEGATEELIWKSTARQLEEPGEESLRFETDEGVLNAVYHGPVRDGDGFPAVVWVGGAADGLDGPAAGLYPSMCARLQDQHIAGLRLSYRRPNELAACVLDVLLAVEFLRGEGAGKIALVGHSFGGAVVITAGAVCPAVAAVVPLSSQTYGTQLVPRLAPRPLLLVHGEADEILPVRCSRHIFAAAQDPKEIVTFPGAHHGLDEAREELIKLLEDWLPRRLGG